MPLRLLRDESDAGPVWYSEAYYQRMINHPISWVELPGADNVVTTYVAGTLKTAPHPQAAAHFLAFLTSSQGQAVYRKYGFMPPPSQETAQTKKQ